MIVQCMLKRRNAGFGDPPQPYYTNNSESANPMIKRTVNFTENEISHFIQEMIVLLQQRKTDVESGILEKGPFELGKVFRNFYISECDWFRKRNEQRDRHMETFHKAKLSN